MTTFKATVQKHHRRSDNTYPVSIRVTHNRVLRYIHTEYYLSKDDLTKGFKIKNQSIVDKLDKIIKKYRQTCNEIVDRLKLMSADQVVIYLSGGKEDKSNSFKLDFLKYGREKVKELQGKGRAGNANTYRVMLNSLEEHIGRPFIDISEINVRFLKDYIKWLETKPAPDGRVKGNRAPSLYMSNMRALHNMAKKDYNDEDAGIINIPWSPFKNIDFPETPEPEKRSISVDQIRTIAALPYTLVLQPGMNTFNLAKDLFLLSFGLIGMNAVDLFNCDCYENGRITYNRTKTMNRRKDKAEISIRVEPEILPLVEKYRDKTGKRVFSFYQHYKSVNTFSYSVNKGLKTIGALKSINIDDFEFYSARHSWGTIANNQAKVDKYTVHTALNHKVEEMKVTDMYIDKDWSLIDRANRKVLNFVKLKIGPVEEQVKVRLEKKVKAVSS